MRGVSTENHGEERKEGKKNLCVKKGEMVTEMRGVGTENHGEGKKESKKSSVKPCVKIVVGGE